MFNWIISIVCVCVFLKIFEFTNEEAITRAFGYKQRYIRKLF